MNPRRETLTPWAAGRFVKVALPTVHTGIGDALRHAYRMDGETRSLIKFEDLLLRLE